jgi:hypothetical protein
MAHPARQNREKQISASHYMRLYVVGSIKISNASNIRAQRHTAIAAALAKTKKYRIGQMENARPGDWMLPFEHVLYGLIVSFLLYYLAYVPLIGAVIIFIVSWGIDVDHYLFYVFKKKDVSLHRAYRFFHDLPVVKLIKKQGKRYDAPLCAFHTIEAVIIMIILSFYSEIARYVLFGAILHFVGDIYHMLVILKEPRARRYTIFNYIKEHYFSRT